MSLSLEDGPPPSADGVWLSVSDVARTKGVEKSSVSRRLKRLEEQGLIETRAYAEDIAAAVAKGDVPGCRAMLQSVARELSDAVADRFAPIGDEAALDVWPKRAERLSEMAAETNACWQRLAQQRATDDDNGDAL